MAGVNWCIDFEMTDEEIEQMYAELGDKEPTEENIEATPTWQRIWERICIQIETDEEETEHEGA